MFYWRTLVLGLLALGLVLGTFAPGMAEEIKIGAGAAPTENIFNKVKGPMEQEAGLKLVLISNGPVEALKELDKGTIDAATAGLTFADWMALMDKEGYAIADKNVYKHRVIGKDIIKVITHKDVGVKQLSKEQLQSLFTGKVTNWKAVGGPDLPVVVVWGSKIPGTQSVFQKQAMNGEAYTKQIQEVGTAAEVKAKVVATPGAVGVGPVSLIDATVTAPEIPEFGRPVTLITKGEPSPTVIKLLDYLRGPGQKHLK